MATVVVVHLSCLRPRDVVGCDDCLIFGVDRVPRVSEDVLGPLAVRATDDGLSRSSGTRPTVDVLAKGCFVIRRV
ncbi:hypothetical protein SISSUDRAFT_1053897 [Sistotremastrum suecicum HHB10207 ss-3]|uniref:Uncharacterized protein n=1 Tax=Sistotremastrum suecicum HHB10207 ss-3 TaxID=1314776 RepID=A0A165YWZ8_9AGAM|nr:hypothetical protein SISSUDRAFT_1053897 [Sistotremastrum suecicum HHB10207 ss-3]